MNLKKSLRKAMLEKDKKPAEVASALGVGYQQVSKWCNGDGITMNNLRKLADFFDMKLSEFIALGESEV